MPALHVAHAICRPVRPIARVELLANVLIVVCGRDRAHDGWVAELLRVVQVIAAGVACGVEVANVLNVVADRADYVAFPLLYTLRAGQGNLHGTRTQWTP